MKTYLVHALLPLVAVLICFAFSERGVAQITFGSPMFYPAGTTATGFVPAPGSVAVGDFNNDGRPDLAVVNPTSNSISILLGNADGTFQAPVPYTVGVNPQSIAVVDLNLDKKQDLAVAFSGDIDSLQTGGASLLLGNGDGTFRAAPSLPNSGHPWSIVAGDFNGDHKPDLAISNGSVSVFLGNGDGTLRSATSYAVTGSIGVGDVNGDGRQDLLVTTSTSISNETFTGDASVLLGNGNGTFEAAIGTRLGGRPLGGSTIGDFNGDGHLDFAALVQPNIFAPRLVKVFLGRGDGTFGSGVSMGGIGLPTASDLNADGIPDLLVLDFLRTGQADVYLGLGDGTFQLAQTIALSKPAWNAAVGDFNGDLLPDLAMTIPDDNVVAIALNTTTDFTLSASALSPATVTAGGSATSTLTLGAANGFTGSISLTCAVQPLPQLAPQCSIPSSVNPGTPVTLTVTTSAPTFASATPLAARPNLIYAVWFPLAGFALVGLGSCSSRRKNGKRLGVLCCSLLFAGLCFQVACGGGIPRHQVPGTPQGQYTTTVTATSGGLRHPTTVTLTVQ